jgi:hypothetical protein
VTRRRERGRDDGSHANGDGGGSSNERKGIRSHVP